MDNEINYILFHSAKYCCNIFICWAAGDVFFGVSSFGSVSRQRSNNEVMRSFVGSVLRQRPTGNSGVVFFWGVRSEGPLSREHHSINTTRIAEGLSC
jgi:hypothetical protein